MPEKDTTHIVKDRGAMGGALPGIVEELEKAVESRRNKNEKAMEGKVVLKHGHPSILSGDTVLLAGLGERFSGKWVVEKHTITLSRSSGLGSELQVSRNALGDTTQKEKTTGDLATDTTEGALDGTGTSTEGIAPEALDANNYSFEEFRELTRRGS